jgi:hypothetical protein
MLRTLLRGYEANAIGFAPERGTTAAHDGRTHQLGDGAMAIDGRLATIRGHTKALVREA